MGFASSWSHEHTSLISVGIDLFLQGTVVWPYIAHNATTAPSYISDRNGISIETWPEPFPNRVCKLLCLIWYN